MLYEIAFGSVAIYLLVKFFFSHWTRRGIPQLRPTFPFGDVADTFRLRKCYADRAADLYTEAVRAGHRFVGMYVLFQPILLVTDADLIKQIMTKDFDHFTDRGTHVNEAKDPLSGQLFNLAGQKWKRMRTLLSPAFTSAKLKAMFPIMEDCGRTLASVIDRNQNRPIDIRFLLSRYTMDIIASVGFGVECNSLENPDVDFYRIGTKFFKNSLKTGLRMLLAFIAPGLNKYLQLKLVDDDVEDYMMQLVRETIDLRENTSVSRKDFIQQMLQLRNQGQVTDDWETGTVSQVKILSVEEIAAQSFVFLVAGFETSSSTMAFCLFELCRNLELQARVQDEIDRVLANRRPLSYEAMNELTFLECCIDETLRKYPIAPILFRKCTKAYQIPGTKTVLEKGTMIHIPLRGLQFDPKYYPNPLKFDPERFAEPDAKNMPYYPFGDGPRNCIGLRLGKLMTKMGLVELLSKYSFTLDPMTPSGETKMDPKLFLLQSKNEIKLIPHIRC